MKSNILVVIFLISLSSFEYVQANSIYQPAYNQNNRLRTLSANGQSGPLTALNQVRPQLSQISMRSSFGMDEQQQQYGYGQKQTVTVMPPPPPPTQTLPSFDFPKQQYGYAQQTTTMPPPPPPMQTLPPQTQPTPVVQQYGYSQQTTTMPPPPPPPQQTVPSPVEPVFQQQYGYGQQQQSEQKLEEPFVQKTSMNEQQVQDQKINDQIQQILDNSVNFNLDQIRKPVSQTLFKPNQKRIPLTGFDQSFPTAITTTTTTTTTTSTAMAPRSGLLKNPCTAEVLRMSEIMLFKDPSDKTCYLICTDINVYHSMPCPEGTVFNDEMHHCVPEGYEAPKCPDMLCKNDADCLVDEGENFKCICKVGFTGQFCQVNIDECESEGNSACGSEGKCVDQINGYYCLFPSGLIGLRRESAIANPCTLDNFAKDTYFFEIPSVNGDVWLQCVSESRFVMSKCAEHLFWNSELETCTMERPMPKSGVCVNLPCKNGGECQDLGSSNFNCLCRSGFTGQQCETIVDMCDSNPCSSNGRCLSWVGGFTCVCVNRIVDETCTSGLRNPCPASASLIPGFNDYFPHILPEKFFQCDKDGRAFARSCPTDLKWKQEVLSCVASSLVSPLKSITTTVSSRIANKMVFDQNRMITETDPSLAYDLVYDEIPAVETFESSLKNQKKTSQSIPQLNFFNSARNMPANPVNSGITTKSQMIQPKALF